MTQENNIIHFIQTTPEELNALTCKSVKEQMEELKQHFQPKIPEELLPRKEVADLFKINLSTLFHWANKGKLKAYWNTFHWQNKIISSGNRIYGRYCKNRFCTICSAIRKADIINRYYLVLKTWEEPHFLTLTVKAVKAKSLSKWINGLFRAFSLILGKYKKRYQRGKGIQLIGVKSLECNFNPQRKTYNPHFHIITANKEIAGVLKKEWL